MEGRLQASFVEVGLAFFSPFGFSFGLIDQQTVQSLAGEMTLPLQVARHDQVSFRMPAEPSLSPLQKLLNLVIRDPVVLFIVEHRNQNIKVSEQILEPGGSRDRQRYIRRVTPLGKGLI